MGPKDVLQALRDINQVDIEFGLGDRASPVLEIDIVVAFSEAFSGMAIVTSFKIFLEKVIRFEPFFIASFDVAILSTFRGMSTFAFSKFCRVSGWAI